MSVKQERHKHDQKYMPDVDRYFYLKKLKVWNSYSLFYF